MLATPVGHDCAGAVRFATATKVETVVARPGEVTWLSDDEVAGRLRDLRQDATSWLGQTFTGQFSLAGAQAKTALLYRDGRWGVPSGAIPTTHILKPAVAGLDDHDLNEHFCLDAARRAGLTVARTRVSPFGDEAAIVVTRYDRRTVDGEVLRDPPGGPVPGARGRPSRKYENEGGRGREIVALVRRAMAPRDAIDAIGGSSTRWPELAHRRHRRAREELLAAHRSRTQRASRRCTTSRPRFRTARTCESCGSR